MNVSRRQVLTGIGAATAAGALAATVGTADAAPSGGSGGFDAAAGPVAGAILAGATLTPGLAYLPIDPTAFGPIDSASGRLLDAANGARLSVAAGGLMTPLPVPVGGTLKELVFTYASAAGAADLTVFKKPLTAAYGLIGTATPLPNGAGILTANVALNELVDGSSTFMVLMRNMNTTQSVHGLLVGYLPPPQAYIPITPVNRVLDTRNVPAGKLNPNEERVVALGVPGFAKAAVINFTVTETEGAGFAAVFRADQAWPGNSSINWSSTGQNLANGVIAAVDATGSIKIRAGGGRTHVVIDVQGYLL